MNARPRRARVSGSLGGLVSAVAALWVLGACASTSTFNPKGDYPPDPWVKGYSNIGDCQGGEDLAARAFALPDYPRAAFRAGRQGWVIIRLDVSDQGETENVTIERAVPDRYFARPSRVAVENWSFRPPKERLEDCRVLIRYRFGTVSLGG